MQDTSPYRATPLPLGGIMARGARFRLALTPTKIKGLKPTDKTQRIADGDGLYLVVAPIAKGGGKTWQFRATVRDNMGGRGQLYTRGLGNIRDIPLADAREWSGVMRSVCRQGRSPATVKIDRNRDGKLEVVDWHPNEPQVSNRRNPTFAKAFEAFFAFRRQRLTSEAFEKQWFRDVERLAFPHIGGKPIGAIGHADITTVLEPIWLAKPDTASKVAQRLEGCFEFARAKGWYSSDNPVKTARAGLGVQPDVSENRPAMDWRELPGFWQRIDDLPARLETRMALRALILTASRSKEVRFARFDQLDEKRNAWVRPAELMKTKEPHAVPITPQLAAIFDEARLRFRVKSGGLIFPGTKPRQPMSDSSLSKLMRSAGFQGMATPHGFRSTFRDWAADNGESSDAAERQLAHVLSGVRSAYERTQLFDARIILMHRWNLFVTGSDK